MLNTSSKLTYEDSKHFNILIDDIFPNIEKDSLQLQIDLLLEPVKLAASAMTLTLTDIQMKKIFELYNQLHQRMGVILLGPSGSGKSTMWKILQKAMALINKPVRTYWINPKSLPKHKLLGQMDIDTREWSDGILTAAAREIAKNSSTLSWIICDGDIDSEWIEALNSLTLPTGERIRFGSNLNFIFETDNLACASPATVSRMGIVLVSEEDMSIQDCVNHWLSKYLNSNPDMSTWINDHLYRLRCLDWIWARQAFEIKISNVGTVRNALSHLGKVTSRDEFLVAIFRGLAQNLKSECRNQFALEVVFHEISIPDEQNFDIIYYDRRRKSLLAYTDEIDMQINNSQLLAMERRPYILTASAKAYRDTVSNYKFICSWLEESNRQPFMVLGPDGSGKESLIRYCLELDSMSQIAVIHCSAQTGCQQILDLFYQYCVETSSASGRILKPKDKPNLVIYIKALNVVKPDKWGSYEIIAFLQQLLTYGGYYKQNLEWISLENIQVRSELYFFTLSFASDEGHCTLPLRFVSLLRLCVVKYPSNDEIITIYASYLAMLIKDWTLLSNYHPKDIAKIMVHLFNQIRNTFRPTDEAHYLFTLKDLTNWVSALMRYEINGSNADDKFLRSMVHECRRIFKDRLVSDEHKQIFEDILHGALPPEFVYDDESNLYVTAPEVLPVSMHKGALLSLVYCEEYINLLQTAVKQYGKLYFEVGNLKMPIHHEFAKLCSRIDRGITLPGTSTLYFSILTLNPFTGGSLLLAGRAGMGRREAVLLVANIHGMPIFTPKMTISYGMKQFRNDLKTVILDAVVNNKHVVFIVENHHLLCDTFLQLISSLLSSGDVLRIFTSQELDSILLNLRDHAAQDAFQGNLLSYLALKVKVNLHIVLIMNIDDTKFSVNCSSNQSLFKECSVIWNETWNADTLLQLANLILSRNAVKVSDDTLVALRQIYHFCPYHLASPAKYILFIKNYIHILNKKRNAVEIRTNRLKTGIDKLTEAREAVSEMHKKAAKKSKLLTEKQADADAALKAISQSMKNASYQRADMEQLKLAVVKENEKIENEKTLIEVQLREVEPLLREAREAVGSIRPESLSEIRSLRAPPETIRDILQAVLLLLSIFDTSWEAMRKFLAKNSMKEEIINFDAQKISLDIHKKVSMLVKNKEASFDPKNAKRASAAAAPLAAWVKANLDYSTILRRVEPLQKEKNCLIKNLSEAENQMKKLSKDLETVDEQVAKLKHTFEARTEEATQIKIDLDKEQNTIRVAGTLVDRLSGEYNRWQQQLDGLQKELNCLEKGSLLSAAFTTFLGSELEQSRDEISKKWKNLLGLNDFNVLDFNVLESEKLNWSNEGLSTDAFSQENAMILFNTVGVPFIIDFRGHVSSFLENHIKSNFEKVSADSSDFITQVLAIVKYSRVFNLYESKPAKSLWLFKLTS
ncbi:unnamed protein product [Thelazia callipaeda]|uniref:AAA_5 domain-containing protein n=1 Tax=Thelazia callipaeda TaxID=103827 RepID=A0A0N5DAZ4_THECL|nr:unnamed protein product [Thelazia callipaeda]